MIIPGFDGASYDTEFPSQADVLKYLHSFANHFELNEHIKYEHMVTRVRLTENTKWEIIAMNLINDTSIKAIHDVLFVCNGHFFEPFIPSITGAHEFHGKLIHSHDFRSAEIFRGIYLSTTVFKYNVYVLYTDLKYKQSHPNRTKKRRRNSHYWDGSQWIGFNVTTPKCGQTCND